MKTSWLKKIRKLFDRISDQSCTSALDNLLSQERSGMRTEFYKHIFVNRLIMLSVFSRSWKAV